ncbi:hypothetical protein ACKZDW_21245 [Ralstonia syzygii subsp. celebesensis]|uniref:Transmembrane protein n=4 Tax=Ralstonia solanacearum species complex TaxID=3116862 RepID=A0AAD0WF85_RALSL|nr:MULTISPECIES: hypothetical protein [Ralstonia solanacearum species complex]CCA79771.1 conserved hypothetical protein [blood disease bacterium R229]BEU71164.1 hypothetical protein MAFF211271_07190 [Ralstonia pseudosolanacearum]AMP36686.1 hypothetical protein LBM2029_03665 [Ralstonia solanacearum]AQW29422.1 hypothetical protein B0B51_04970 [blood disease bacterium A2-HR MARDI]AXV76140.1 hypothetical protein CJO76_03685 [Ralstonia solanacearum]
MDFAAFFAIEQPGLFKAAIMLALPLDIWLWFQFFGDRHGFLRSLRLALQPDIVSALRGEYDEAFWESLRMLAFAASCAAGTTLVYKVLKRLT